jgi:hypothetical protein
MSNNTYDEAGDKAMGFPCRIELFVYGHDNRELRHMKYDGNADRCKELDDTLSKLFARWQRENSQIKFCGQCGEALAQVGFSNSCMNEKCVSRSK